MIELVGNAATAVTIAMFLCPLPMAIRTYRARSCAQNFNLLPYVATGMTAVLWLRYGLLIHDPPMTRVNFVGAILEIFYSLIFYRFIGPMRPKINTAMILGAFSFTFSCLLLVRFMDDDLAVSTLGTIASVVNVVTFASPLASLKEVFRTQNCSSFPPLPLQITMFVTPSLWFYYSQLIHDRFLAVPNGLGVILGLVQLLVRFKFSGSNEFSRLETMKMEA